MSKDEKRIYWLMLALLIVGAAILAIPGCGKNANRPNGGSLKNGQSAISAPKAASSQEARDQAGDLRSQIDGLELQIAQLEREAKILEGQEQRARWVAIARIVQIASALAALAGVALFGLSFWRPELSWLRKIAALGAGLAVIIFGLVQYLPDAIRWAAPLSLAVTIATVIWLIWRIVRDNKGFASTVKLFEEAKPYLDLGDQERKQFQREIIGDARASVDAMRKRIGLH